MTTKLAALLLARPQSPATITIALVSGAIGHEEADRLAIDVASSIVFGQGNAAFQTKARISVSITTSNRWREREVTVNWAGCGSVTPANAVDYAAAIVGASEMAKRLEVVSLALEGAGFYRLDDEALKVFGSECLELMRALRTDGESVAV